jgi:putative membrane protein
MHPTQTLTVPSFRQIGVTRAITLIVVASAVACGFLFWIIYFRPATAGAAEQVAALPAVNASLNLLSALLLVAGYVAIRSRQYLRHTRLMLGALACSALFLASYVTYYAVAGNTVFGGTGLIRPVYFFILITHILLSVVALPLILLSVFLSLSGRLAMHRRVARYTLPIWLYVSVTGVMVFVLLRLVSWN